MIPLSAQTNQAVAMLSCMAEACAKDAEANETELAAAASVDVPAARLVLNELALHNVVVEGFDPGGWRLAKEPAALTLFDIAVIFERRLQNNLAGIARAMRPVVEEYLRGITFAACASGCSTEAGIPEIEGDCPRSKLAQAAQPTE